MTIGTGRAIAAAALRRTHCLGGAGWAVLVTTTVGTNLIDALAIGPPGASRGRAFALAAIVRVVAVFWATWALQRQLCGTPRPFRMDASLARSVALQVALAMVAGLTGRLALIAAGPVPSLQAFWLATFLSQAVVALALVRLLAWTAAVATGAPLAGVVPLWRAQAGHGRAIGYALAVLVLPLLALHLALTLVMIRVAVAPAPRLALALLDGGVQVGQLLLTLALAAVALDLADGRSVEAAAARR